VKSFFKNRRAAASIKFAAFQHAVLEGETAVNLGGGFRLILMDPLIPKRIPWNSCKLTTTLLLISACPSRPESMRNDLKWQSRSLGGLPDMAEISNNPAEHRLIGHGMELLWSGN
jgi:hypothetical protein